MNLNDVYAVRVARKSRKRVGRGEGSGRGKTCGRGTKGAGQRSGHSTNPGFEGGQMPLFRRLPKRGFNNARFRREISILNLDDLKAFEPGSEVTLEAARGLGLVPKRATRLKVLGKGELDRPLNVKAHRFSASAREAIVAAGGTAEETGS